MDTADELRELRGLNKRALEERLESVREELMNLRFRHSSGQLTNTAQLGTIRKRIARVCNVLGEVKRGQIQNKGK